ncbi:calcium/calmodulin-dependent protein kinase type IV, partial [Elysia marginata]
VVNIGEYSEIVASRAVKDIIAGVGYLHRCGYVHKNLKPENLLYENLSEDSPLKISDFALSSILSTEVDMSSVCGSPGYAAPELLKGERFGSAVDMWAIGIITYIFGIGASNKSLENVAGRIKTFNEQQKAKGPSLEVSSTPRSRAISRADQHRDLSPLPGVDLHEVVAALPADLNAPEKEESASMSQEDTEEIKGEEAP